MGGEEAMDGKACLGGDEAATRPADEFELSLKDRDRVQLCKEVVRERSGSYLNIR